MGPHVTARLVSVLNDLVVGLKPLKTDPKKTKLAAQFVPFPFLQNAFFLGGGGGGVGIWKTGPTKRNPISGRERLLHC